jgi:hypothetical protein
MEVSVHSLFQLPTGVKRANLPQGLSFAPSAKPHSMLMQHSAPLGPWSAEFVAISEAMRALPFKRVMLDGEAVAHCLDGLPHFHRLLGNGQATACLTPSISFG